MPDNPKPILVSGSSGWANLTTTGLAYGNLQLESWNTACTVYSQVRNSPSPKPAALVETVNRLGESLLRLFGANEPGDPTNPKGTPALTAFVAREGLEVEKPHLHAIFVELNRLYDAARHIDQSKRPMLEALTVDQVARFMEATRQIWIWYVGKRTGNDPRADLSAFKEPFATL